MINLHTVIEPNLETRFVHTDDCILVVSFARGYEGERALQLTSVSKRFCELASGDLNIGEIVDKLINEFKVERSVLEQDLLNYANQLIEADLYEIIT